MEEFYTIQGEGFHTGTAAYFTRIGGCDVGCHWCDVKESWDASIHPLTSIDAIVENASQFPARTIVITGGEPLMYNLSAFSKQLKDRGFSVHIETSGSYPLSGNLDWICLSPKKTLPPLPEILPKANELKCIIYNQNDFQWAEEHAKKVHEKCRLFLQPEWSRREKMMPAIIDYVMANPQWRVSLQTHKYMNIP
ncbi:MAG: 7-carboxy-7-deazaguanine synthase QueE [Bacteroidia bacterium]|nr:7-carboxy-7-deazaguanine synthase QueE [Bacteroidia bacterium]